MWSVHALVIGFGGPNADVWSQVSDLVFALVLCSLIGAERELYKKSAGLRTHATVGLAAALIVEVSKFGFADVLGSSVTLDPSRIASQVVTGIGFMGAGLIFIRRDTVQGLTTAAVVWLGAAVGMACGAGLPGLGGVAVGGYLVIATGLRVVEKLFDRHAGETCLHLRYRSGQGVLRKALDTCTQHDVVVSGVRPVESDASEQSAGLGLEGTGLVALVLRGKLEEDLVSLLTDLPGMVEVQERHMLDGH